MGPETWNCLNTGDPDLLMRPVMQYVVVREPMFSHLSKFVISQKLIRDELLDIIFFNYCICIIYRTEPF